MVKNILAYSSVNGGDLLSPGDADMSLKCKESGRS